jgi:hypothetical protein
LCCQDVRSLALCMECWCVHCDALDCIWITLPPHNVLVRVRLTLRPAQHQLHALLSASCKQPILVTLNMLYWEDNAWVSELLDLVPPVPVPFTHKQKSFISKSMRCDRDDSQSGAL